MKHLIPILMLSVFGLFGCAEGKADCPGNEVACGDFCANTQEDPTNCGGCGIVCGGGELCFEGSCACPDGESKCDPRQADLYALCFQGGEMIPFLSEFGVRSGPTFSGMEGPQAMALLDEAHLVVVGSIDQTLYVVDRATMKEVSSLTLARGTGPTMPNHVVVRDERAYVVNSGTNEVVAVDLTNPSAPKVAYSVSTGEGSNPMAATIDDAGTLWVTLWMTSQLLPISLGEKDGVALAPIEIPAGDIEGIPYPAGVTTVGDEVYVSLNNLDGTWGPAGNGRLWVYSQVTMTGELIDLGSACRNPGLLTADGDRVLVACSGSYSGDGAVAIYDPGQAIERTTIAIAGAPTRISSHPSSPDRFFVADSMSVDILVVGLGGVVEKRIPACSEREWEFVSDVLAVP